ncbi:NCS1 nucleoside transporter family [Russula earlei]|uniref:NCS1 nucleoside transporter family n=1 Tax=Russula earlei TaxID=71964 RepID=A0ACC0TW76_9AGAM|nr:NCS1 nucleoside transporter family [Russula earlei]
MQESPNITTSSLYSDDLAPVPVTKRTWGTWNYAALWISMSLCIPSYTLASSLINGGMNWWQAIVVILLGNLVVLIPMYGIPFPVFARASFGVKGANIPAMLRAIVACGWFGIQTWIGGHALYQMLHIWFPSLATLPQTGPAITFFLFWLINMYIIYLAALALLFWAISAAHGLGPILHQPSKFATNSDFFHFFFPALTGVIGFWATLSLNIPDFTRYAKSQRAQIRGQAIALPSSMTLISFIGVVVTSATTIIYGTTIWDPVELAGKFDSKLIVSFVMIAVVISTLATNIAANIVSPANDIANLSPSKISFKTGGYITGYSSLLGPIGGIMIVDYYFIRHQQLLTDDLYKHQGAYTFSKGFNRAAIIALLAGILPNVPGFFATIGVIPQDAMPAWIIHLYNYAWFVGFVVSGLAYWLLFNRKEHKAHN